LAKADIARTSESIDNLIAEHSAEREQANYEARAWNESEQTYRARRRLEWLQEWHEHFLALAATHDRLADENRAKAIKLIDEQAS